MERKGDRFKVNFNTKETWAATWEQMPKQEWYQGIWFSHVTPKYSILVWLATKNRLTTGDRMLSWNTRVNPSCVFCHELQKPETFCSSHVTTQGNFGQASPQNFLLDSTLQIGLLFSSSSRTRHWKMIVCFC